MECLSNIIGLTNRECECFSEMPEGADVSNSGLYIDDLYEESNILKLTESLSCDDEIWTVLANARSGAIKDFVRDLSARIAENNSRVINYRGQLGKIDKANKLVTVTGSDIGVQIDGNVGYKSAYVTISSVGLKIDTTGTYTVTLKRDGVTLETWEVDAVAGKVSMTDGKYIFPMFSLTGNPYTYGLTWTPAGARPYNTATFCCSGKDKNWSRIINVLGTQDGELVDKPMYGLVVNLSISCNLEWICSEFDFDTDPWAATMAKTIQLIAISKVYKYIQSSGLVNRYTVLEKPEYLLGKMKSLAKQIDERYNYLSVYLPEEGLDCWHCDKRINVAKIQV